MQSSLSESSWVCNSAADRLCDVWNRRSCTLGRIWQIHQLAQQATRLATDAHIAGLALCLHQLAGGRRRQEKKQRKNMTSGLLLCENGLRSVGAAEWGEELRSLHGSPSDKLAMVANLVLGVSVPECPYQ